MSRWRKPTIRYQKLAHSAVLHPAWATISAANLAHARWQRDISGRGIAVPLKALDDVLAVLEMTGYVCDEVVVLEAVRRR